MVTIYDNTLKSVVTKSSHFQLGINNIYELYTACKGLYEELWEDGEIVHKLLQGIS